MRNCKNCGIECVSIYCCKSCNTEYKKKTGWITTKCLTCGKEIISRISRIKTFCSSMCCSKNENINKKRSESVKRTCLEKYGTESYNNVEKNKQTCLEKYGVDSFSKTKEFKNKFKNTCLKRYGVYYPQQSKKIREKTKNTVDTKYGGFTYQSDILMEKVRKTMIQDYGVENSLKSEYIKNKVADTNIRKYGFITPLKNKEVIEKTKNTLREKWGVESNISQNKIISEKVKDSFRNNFLNNIFEGNRLNNIVIPLFKKEEYIDSDYSNLYSFSCKKCNTIFKDNLYAGHIPRCTTCYPKSISKPQMEIFEYIKSLLPNIDILQNVRHPIYPLELDIFIPSLNLAFEYHGFFWHSEMGGGKNKNYHLNKFEEANKNNIRLIQIFEDDWRDHQNTIKIKIKHLLKLNTTNKIYARNCEIKEIDVKIKNEFLEKYHLQGKDCSPIKLGAYYNNELIAVMTFGKLRLVAGNKTAKENEYEMYRFCIGDKNVVGIAGKLFNTFVKKYDPELVISYTDKRYSNTNDCYLNSIGFNLLSETSPGYWYLNGYTTKVHRFNFRKSELHKKLQSFDPSLTEWENMQLNGYDRIWDCGNLKYVWENKNFKHSVK